MQLDEMTLDELRKHRKEVDKAIASFEERRLREAREKLEAQAREMGFTLNEVMGNSKRVKAPSAPKYRHPENADLTWTGRGRKPKWISEALERGEDIGKFEI